MHGYHENDEDYCQSVYKKMCSGMGIMVSNYFLRHLLTTEIVMKHSYLGVRGAKACCAALLVRATSRYQLSVCLL